MIPVSLIAVYATWSVIVSTTGQLIYYEHVMYMLCNAVNYTLCRTLAVRSALRYVIVINW